MIDRGRKVAEGTTDELKTSVGASTLQLRLADPERLAAAAEIVQRVLGEEPVLTPEAGGMNVALEVADQAADALIALRQSGIGIASVSVAKPSLDEVFLALTGHDTHEARPRRARRRTPTTSWRPSDDDPDRREPDRDPAAARPPTRSPTGSAPATRSARPCPWPGARPRRCVATRSSSSTSLIQPLLFTAMFAYIFGGAISGDVASYLPLIIPGILAQTTLTACIATGIQLREDMDKGVFDRFKSLPIARIAPLAGPMIADVIRYTVATVLTFATGLAMGYRPGGGPVGVLAAAVLVIGCGWSMAWIFTWVGIKGRSAQAVQAHVDDDHVPADVHVQRVRAR